MRAIYSCTPFFFPDEKIKVQRKETTCLRSHSFQLPLGEGDYNLGSLGLTARARGTEFTSQV